VIVEDEPIDGARASRLVAEMLADLNERYGPGDFRTMAPRDFEAPDGAFLVVVVGGSPAACGGFLRVDERTAELKRMFVRPAWRGRGVARRLLAELEGRAAALGYRRMRLETGVRQPEAIALYRSAGYDEVPRFPPFEDDERSVCFAKTLTVSGSAAPGGRSSSGP
jgi:GNAT superfamily N-acetyltransferase